MWISGHTRTDIHNHTYIHTRAPTHGSPEEEKRTEGMRGTLHFRYSPNHEEREREKGGIWMRVRMGKVLVFVVLFGHLGGKKHFWGKKRKNHFIFYFYSDSVY